MSDTQSTTRRPRPAAMALACAELGIPFVFSAPLVRSSYNAEQAYASLLNRQQHMPCEAAEPHGSEQP